MKCPACGCLQFYVKDADDEYDIHEFSVTSGSVAFPESQEPLAVEDPTHVYCNGCAWHGEFSAVRKAF